MVSLTRHAGLMRDKTSEHRGRVAPVELFFDLVFVFAITQLSHTLLHKLTVQGLVETTLLFFAVWWVWVYTTWFTNWIDPDRTPVRLALFVLMLAGLVMSISIPSAFGAGGLAFACAYVFMQVGRSAFTVCAIGTASESNARNFQRILAWLVLSGLFWIAGAFAEGNARLALWAIAIGLEYFSPWVGFWVPKLGRSTTGDWDIDGHHMAERCSLFVLIALGESLIITGSTFEKSAVTPATVAALVSAVVGTAAMWWVYFAIGAERGTHHIAHAADPGRVARVGYTYLHIIIVAGVIIAAVADELVLGHPGGHVALPALLAIVGAPVVFLLGNGYFKWLSAPYFPLSHLAGLAVLAVVGATEFQFHLSTPLALSLVTTGVLVLVALWEWLSLTRSKGAPHHI
ncbi:low temperature requirement protein A [Phreatobacter stygius]|uniref:Low temperature requirement protein A n=1 Tax=Phreatobacter stygius TaxID=1940610 RepID=A0A4D7B144_9HYPH|nr:low temperature requirement protein A [Phreatobacter stygius]QCI63760.1 low temperature requirement protein A [Phreatobacter stygius]